MLTALTTLYNDLKAKNTAAINAQQPLDNARIARNVVLYTPTTGLVDTVHQVKDYVKSVFGASSPQYKQITALQFSQPKR